jgi:HSP20 family protein
MYDLIRRNAMQGMSDFQRQFDRFFNAPLFGSGVFSDEGRAELWYPSVDMFENDDSLIIKAELAGLSKDDIDVNIENGKLTLSGERKSENEVEEDKYYRRERTYGKFVRTFALPADVDPEKITAEFNDGVLNIKVPKPEGKKPKQITVH